MGGAGSKTFLPYDLRRASGTRWARRVTPAAPHSHAARRHLDHDDRLRQDGSEETATPCGMFRTHPRQDARADGSCIKIAGISQDATASRAV